MVSTEMPMKFYLFSNMNYRYLLFICCDFSNECAWINDPLSILEISLSSFDIYTWIFFRKIAREIL
jgi:hypothetical protein